MAIGDPHGNLDRIKQIPVKDIDLILLTGDLGSANLMRKMVFENIDRQKLGLKEKEFSSKQKKVAFMEAYNSSIKIIKHLTKFAPVYTIYGNVEKSNIKTKRFSKEIGLSLPFLTNALNAIARVQLINNKLLTFKGVKIGGLQYFIDTDWVVDFKPDKYEDIMKEAQKDTSKAKKLLAGFGYVDILLHHQPPYGILDRVGSMAPRHWQGKHAGSRLILDYVKRKQPKYSFCGHIHESEGKKVIGKTQIYNLGVCGYKIVEL